MWLLFQRALAGLGRMIRAPFERSQRRARMSRSLRNDRPHELVRSRHPDTGPRHQCR
jgi:hypothetical protein